MWHEWSPMKKLIWLRKFAAGAKAVLKTLTGAAPLTFTAIAKAFHSLIQYGKIIQNSTPTPSAPAPIVCNNGTLTMVDDELPSGYKRLLGITYDGNFRYETGEYLTGDDDVTMTLDNPSSSGKNVFGSYNGANNKNFSLYIYGSTSGSYFRFGDQLKRPKYGSTGRRTITFGKSGTVGFSENVEIDPDTFTTPDNAYIGMLPNSTSPGYTGDIIGNILVGTRLKWIPAERESDGTIGYYELVNGNFVEPTGSGTPISLGYDTSHLTVLSVVGISEVLKIGTQTASVADLYAVGDYEDEQDIISGAVTRKVGVKVLDGTENWQSADTSSVTRYRLSISGAVSGTARSPVVCSHFTYASSSQPIGGAFLSTEYLYLIPDQSVETVEAFTAFLAEQYAAGTPVIMIYPLAEETTETVSGQALSTYAGTNTVSVVSNVDPVDLKVQYYE